MTDIPSYASHCSRSVVLELCVSLFYGHLPTVWCPQDETNMWDFLWYSYTVGTRSIQRLEQAANKQQDKDFLNPLERGNSRREDNYVHVCFRTFPRAVSKEVPYLGLSLKLFFLLFIGFRWNGKLRCKVHKEQFWNCIKILKCYI